MAWFLYDNGLRHERIKNYRFLGIYKIKLDKRHKNFEPNLLSRSSRLEVLCCVEKVSLENTQNSQKSTCAKVSFLLKLQAWGQIL